MFIDAKDRIWKRFNNVIQFGGDCAVGIRDLEFSECLSLIVCLRATDCHDQRAVAQKCGSQGC